MAERPLPQGFLLDVLKHGARMLCEGPLTLPGRFTTPDADWAPIMMYVAGDNQIRQAVLEISDDKDATAARLRQFLHRMHAREAALVTSGWHISIPIADNVIGYVGPRPSASPQRTETLTVTYVSGKRAITECAEITRYPDRPPSLGKFVPAEDVGRFIEAMKRGIR
jgi:hypothetical protein